MKHTFPISNMMDEKKITSVTVTYEDGTELAIPVRDTAITLSGGYMREGQSSTDGSFPTWHTFVLRWCEDADEPFGEEIK